MAAISGIWAISLRFYVRPRWGRAIRREPHPWAPAGAQGYSDWAPRGALSPRTLHANQVRFSKIELRNIKSISVPPLRRVAASRKVVARPPTASREMRKIPALQTPSGFPPLRWVAAWQKVVKQPPGREAEAALYVVFSARARLRENGTPSRRSGSVALAASFFASFFLWYPVAGCPFGQNNNLIYGIMPFPGSLPGKDTGNDSASRPCT